MHHVHLLQGEIVRVLLFLSTGYFLCESFELQHVNLEKRDQFCLKTQYTLRLIKLFFIVLLFHIKCADKNSDNISFILIFHSCVHPTDLKQQNFTSWQETCLLIQAHDSHLIISWFCPFCSFDSYFKFIQPLYRKTVTVLYVDIIVIANTLSIHTISLLRAMLLECTICVCAFVCMSDYMIMKRQFRYIHKKRSCAGKG